MNLRQRFVFTAAAVTLLVASGYAVATSDAFVKRMVRSLLSRTVRGPATVESASFSFLHGLELRGLEVRDPTEPLGEPAVTVERIVVDYVLFSASGGPGATSILIEKPVVRVRRGADGTFTFGTIVKSPEGGASSALPPPIKITGGEVIFDDPSLFGDDPLVLGGVTGDVSPSPGEHTWSVASKGTSSDVGEVSLDATVRAGGQVDVRARLPEISISERLAKRAKFDVAAAIAKLSPKGFAGVEAQITFVPGGEARIELSLDLRDVDFAIALPDPTVDSPAIPSAPTVPRTPPVPMPVHIDTGRAILRGKDLVLEDLHGKTLGADFTARGEATISGETVLNLFVALKGLRADESVHQHFPYAWRRVIDAYNIRATVDASARISGSAATPKLVLDAQVAQGSVRYDGYVQDDGKRRGFPWAVDGVSGTVTYDGLRILRLDVAGHHGASPVRGSGQLDWGAGDEVPTIAIVAEEVPLDDALKAAFQDRGDAFWKSWGPSGVAKQVEVHVLRDAHVDGPASSSTDVLVDLDGRAGFRPYVFPAQMSGVSGRIEVTAPNEGSSRSELVRLRKVRARAPGMEMEIDGTIRTLHDVSEEELSVVSKVADLAGAFREALLDEGSRVPPGVKSIYREFAPAGAADLVVRLSGGPEGRHDKVDITLHRASVQSLRALPMALSELEGRVVIEGDEVAFPALRGRMLDTTFTAEGRVIGISGDNALQVDAHIAAPHLPLGDPLRPSLGKFAEKAAAFWDELHPVGGVGVEGTRADADVILRPEGDARGPVLELKLDNITGPLRPLGLELDLRDGLLAYDGTTAVLSVDASIGAADFDARARFDVASNNMEADVRVGGLHFPEDLAGIFGDETTADLAEAMPERTMHAPALHVNWDDAARTLSLTGDVSVVPRSSQPSTGYAPQGGLRIASFKLTMPRTGDPVLSALVSTKDFKVKAGVTIDGLTGDFAVSARFRTGERMDLAVDTEKAEIRVGNYVFADARIKSGTTANGVRLDMNALFAGGVFKASIWPGGERSSYAGEMHLSNGHLELITGPRSDIKGVLDADVRIRNPTGEAKDLQGAFGAYVKQGDLVRFPVFSAMFNLIGTVLLNPNAGTLTDAFVEGEIQGNLARVRDLEMSGDWLKVSDGRGAFDFDGNLDLVMHPSIRVPVISELLTVLAPIHVGGTIGAPTVSWAPLGIGGGAPTPPKDPDDDK